MSLICVCSAHGSPGVTTTALALAATWPPHRRCLLVEADPFGGVLAARYGLGDAPGLSSLAAVARSGIDDDMVWGHAQALPGGIPILVGPRSADEAHAVLRDITRALAGWAGSQTEVDVVVDCGRIAPDSPTLEAMTAASAVLVATRPTLDQLRPAAHRLAALEASGAPAGLLLVGDEPYRPDEVTTNLHASVDGVIAWDPRTAAVLAGTQGAVRDLRRSPLVRSAATLAARLAPAPLLEPDAEDDTQPAQGVMSEVGDGRSR